MLHKGGRRLHYSILAIVTTATVLIASKATQVREYEYNITRVRVPRVRVQVSSLIKKCEYYHASRVPCEYLRVQHLRVLVSISCSLL